MDSRLTQLRRLAATGDGDAQAAYWNNLLRSGRIPKQYIQILSLLEHPVAQQVSPYLLPKKSRTLGWRRYQTGVFRLLTQTGVPKKDIYDLVLRFLTILQGEWTSHYPSYAMSHGESTAKHLNYLSSLGPYNPPSVEALKAIITEIVTTFSDRMATRLSLMADCLEITELDILDISMFFLRNLMSNGIRQPNDELHVFLTSFYEVAEVSLDIPPYLAGYLMLPAGEPNAYCEFAMPNASATWESLLEAIFMNHDETIVNLMPERPARSLAKNFNSGVFTDFILERIDQA